MIIEIPSSSEFHVAGVNQLYLAWQISIQAIQDREYVDNVDHELSFEEEELASREYWSKSQPALANAFGLIQQSMEMALKGRIAAISPYLLISRDPKDWPKGVETGPVPFSEFRTLDAADLLKVHNTFSDSSLGEDFRSFWDQVRRDRNKIMHSVSPKSFEPRVLVRTIMSAVNFLFSEIRWPQRLLAMEAEGKYAAYGLQTHPRNVVMRQMDIVRRYLSPADNAHFLGLDTRRRSYVCPRCYEKADRYWESDWPKLAQLTSRHRGSRHIHCVVCNETTEIYRSKCTIDGCLGDVIEDDMCLTCTGFQG